MASMQVPNGHSGAAGRPRATRWRRRSLGVALAALLAQSALSGAARAQGEEAPHRLPRRITLAITGTLLGALAGVLIDKGSSSSGHGGCLGVRCTIVVSTLGGAAAGYLVGREYDRRFAERYRNGVLPLHIVNLAADLQGTPSALAVSHDAIAVGETGGVQLFSTDSGLRAQARRAGGLSGIAHVAIAPRSHWLAVGSPAGLYIFPPGAGRGLLASEGDVSALAAAPAAAYGAIADRLVLVPLGSEAGAARQVATLPFPVRALALDSTRALLWAATDHDLRAFRAAGDSLAPLGATPLAAPGLALAAAHDTIAVALGAQGVELFDAHDPAAPRTLGRWTLARFVYDVSLDAGRLFVAAGPEGVYVVSLRGPPFRTLGLARELGFAWALASVDGHTYILDRHDNSIRRILSDF